MVDEPQEPELLINGETIIQYEIQLRKQLRDRNVLVRCTKNSKNKDAVAISLNKRVYDFLQLIKPLSFQFVAQEEEIETTYTVLADEARIVELARAVERYVIHLNGPGLFGQFADKIALLALKHPADQRNTDTKMQEVIRNLKKLARVLYARAEKWNFALDESRTAILTNFVALTQRLFELKADEKMTEKEMQEFSDKLDKDLYGKPPIDPKIKAVICGIIFVLAGFVIGAMVGAAMAPPGLNGFGALVGAIFGAVKGFGATGVACGAPTVLGTTFGITGIGFSTIPSLFFKRSNDRYYEQRLEKKPTVKTVISSLAELAREENPSVAQPKIAF